MSVFLRKIAVGVVGEGESCVFEEQVGDGVVGAGDGYGFACVWIDVGAGFRFRPVACGVVGLGFGRQGGLSGGRPYGGYEAVE